MTAPLSPAEAIAARAIGGDFECTWHVGCDEECNADRARAVVAAVRGSLYGEVADRLLKEADAAERADATDDRVYAFTVSSDRVRAWAVKAHPQSTTTPEEHQR